MSKPVVICERCNKNAHGITIMSFFNRQTICLPCSELERAHPQFSAARAADEQAIAQGNYNFPGIGLPADLVPQG